MKDVGSGLSGIRVGFVISETIHPPTFFFFFVWNQCFVGV